ncbi:PAS domain-containing sensor histidine kinase [Porphyrobacter sp. TH134]|uniref:two-component system sensor histidine kinase NtrB n=1 Tax=Porphyrobacter sp. TH134 TaxID=2067450 RepID=UPI000C7E4D32|nr:ATP-binding protein [Porphyrobacter sp. TH134]PLK22979.1 PAS domain-containing sensor histidine kinase [Porphyrobacter sp. TH134]
MATNPIEPQGDGRPDSRAQLSGLIFAVILIDGNGVIAEVNHAAEDLLGTSSSRLVGTHLTDRIGPLDPRVEARLLASDEALVARDLLIRVGAHDVRVNLTASPLGGFSGWRVVTLSQIGHDDTAGTAGGEAMLGAPAVLAHEIKNPLAAIRGAAQLAARKLPLADKKLARMITDEVDRIARLIDRMQQLGSTRTGPVQPCNPHEAIRAAVATMRAAGGTKGDVEIREEFDPSLPPLLANRDALEQVLINLISNARDASLGAGGGGQIVVQTRFVSGLAFSAIRNGRAVPLPIEITISDNGPGIDPALQGHVFEPFVSSKPSGQGLGLSLVRKLVRDMNGNISHDRDARAGLTHFRLHLPQAQDIA